MQIAPSILRFAKAADASAELSVYSRNETHTSVVIENLQGVSISVSH